MADPLLLIEMTLEMQAGRPALSEREAQGTQNIEAETLSLKACRLDKYF